MGAWSADIFDDDGAEDIIEEYKILLGYGISQQEAYKKIEDYFYPDYCGQHDEDVYWLAIALFQWQNGILLDNVKQSALKCMEDNSYLERWKDSGEKIYQERKQVLAELKYNLLNVVNEKRKRFLKPPKYERFKTEWNEGDLLAYKVIEPMMSCGELVGDENKERFYETQNLIKNKYILLRVVEIDKMPISSICPELDYCSSAVVMLYDWIGDTIPSSDEISQIPFRPIVNDFWQKPKRIVSSVCLEVHGSREEKKWCEITLVKSEKDYQKPQMYIQHKCSPIRVVSQLNTNLIHTFALKKDEETEWYSDKHFFNQ